MKHKPDLHRLFTCLLLLVGAVLTIAPTPGNLKIPEYPGSSEKEGREGTSDIFAVDHELIQPFDSLTGLPTGRHQHRPLTVLKQIDKASPGLHKALASRQLLRAATLDFYRIDPATRSEVKYYTISLKNVRIVGMKTMMPTSFLPENESYRHMEEVRLVYEDIEWNWIPDGILEKDNWRSGQAASAAGGAQDSPLNSTSVAAPLTESSGAKQNATSSIAK